MRACSNHKRGSQLPQAKMCEKSVREARAEYIRGRQEIARVQRQFSVQGLADRYGISKPAMEKILYRQSWGHVE